MSKTWRKRFFRMMTMMALIVLTLFCITACEDDDDDYQSNKSEKRVSLDYSFLKGNWDGEYSMSGSELIEFCKAAGFPKEKADKAVGTFMYFDKCVPNGLYTIGVTFSFTSQEEVKFNTYVNVDGLTKAIDEIRSSEEKTVEFFMAVTDYDEATIRKIVENDGFDELLNEYGVWSLYQSMKAEELNESDPVSAKYKIEGDKVVIEDGEESMELVYNQKRKSFTCRFRGERLPDALQKLEIEVERK